MDDSEYYNILDNEDTHFFYVSVHDLVLKLFQKYDGKFGLKILDAGCGVGGLALKLSKFGEVSAVDRNENALKLSSMRGVNVQSASVEELPFGDNIFDLVTCIDVIYHAEVESDRRAVSELYRVLKPGGLLIMRVPARKELFSKHDVLVRTARRYSQPEIDSLLMSQGFKIETISYCQSPLYFPAFVKARLEKADDVDANDGHSAVANVAPIVNQAIINTMRIENNLIASGMKMPIGIGVIAVGKKIIN